MCGYSNVIDSLIIVKQFVYDEKIVTMQELTAAVQATGADLRAAHAHN
ncbi:MAG: pyruvate formate lyase family protein [Oscillospiraceae bacterium]